MRSVGRALVPFAALLAAACNAIIGLSAPDDSPAGPSGSGPTSGTMSGASSGSSTGSSTGIQCIDDHDCDAGNPCEHFSCAAGQCVVQPKSDGSKPTGYQDFVKDCQTKQCMGGAVTTVAAPNDAPSGDACRTYSCSGMIVLTHLKPSGSHCGGFGTNALTCDAMGNCAGCTNTNQCSEDAGDPFSCENLTCDTTTTICVATPVSSGTQCFGGPGMGVCDGAGSCVGCATASDCQGFGQQRVCIDSQCVDQCADGVKDGSESDVDCGSGCTYRCALHKTCGSDADCDSNLCLGGACATGCGDGKKDGLETDVDCGGGYCGDCANGESCGADDDCSSGFCNPTTQVCGVPSCTDGFQNGSETGPDCGGSCPGKCANGQGCSVTNDCQSTYCVGGSCVTQCQNQIKDGSETDVDCGGSCPTQCDYMQGCAVDGDCAGGSCSGGTCAATCGDGVKNGDETDVDCGGSCSTKCAQGSGCSVSADCDAGLGCDETTSLCQPTCSDGQQDGDETDVDCGGTCSTKCATGKACSVGADCESGTCTSLVCG